jgi:hypothetical protein
MRWGLVPSWSKDGKMAFNTVNAKAETVLFSLDWWAMAPYRFLIDNDCSSAARYFPKKRVITLQQAKPAPNTPDSDVVARAYELSCTIVTANGPDFEAAMRHFLLKTQRKDCHDLYGLVVIPNQAASQARVLPGLAKRLRFSGKSITWDEVWMKNLMVRVRSDGVVDVRDDLGRCFYCQKIEMQEH